MNTHFVLSALQGLATRAVPLYHVSGMRAYPRLPLGRGALGLYCVGALRQQHRLAVALFQRDYVTCIVSEPQWPYRAALPVYVGACTVAAERATMSAFTRAYAALRLVALHRAVAQLLAVYYACVGRCLSKSACLLCC